MTKEERAEKQERNKYRRSKTANTADAQIGANLYWSCNAEGDMGVPVLVVTDKGIPPGQICIVELPGYARSESKKEAGYVVFLCNQNNAEGKRLFAKWYVEEVLDKQIEETRSFFKESLGDNPPAAIFFDGETHQLGAMIRNFAGSLAAIAYGEGKAKDDPDTRVSK